ncbi:unnamed protein product [Adineta steineri]|uniref:Ashwin n=1 Tax=Adineta steineri TaxID=433720 RepID=A0A814ILK5_9BILA|nr:unnamed protein product [Adineta steineri]CAF1063413.1 unnamed protein product [Adineta steineri]
MNIDLTHPEILTIEQLKKYLIKFVGPDVTNDKYELIQLFYKYIAPLPQRKFRTNRLGTILTQNQRQFGGEKRPLSSDIQNGDKISKSKSQPPIDGLNDQPQGEKHESDRGIYTITMQKSANKNTAPIKLKRPTSTTTEPIATSDEETTKRIKLDDTNA